MRKKIIALGLAFTILFSLAGCIKHPTVQFESLEEMQAALSEDFYYFEFEGVDFSKTGEFVATKNENVVWGMKGGMYRYTISFDVDNPVTGEINRFKVLATHNTQPITIASQYKYITYVYERNNEIVYVSNGLHLEEGSDFVSIFGYEEFWYYFILERKQQSATEEEVEFFLSICKPAIESRYLANDK